MNSSSFTLKKATLLKTLQEISKVLGRTSKIKKLTVLEMTVTDGKLTLVIPGAKHILDCETTSTAKVAINLFYYIDIINTQKDDKIQCTITNNTIEIKGLFIKVQTTFFETDRILRSIKMPINYTDFHLLKLENQGYTEEEIKFNKLGMQIHLAKKRLTSNIRKTIDLLNVYGINQNEIEEIINRKIEL